MNTVFIGNSFHNKTIDIIPDGEINLEPLISISNLIVRMDLNFDEKILEQLLINKKCIIITKKSIDLDLINKYKNNILQIVYLLEEDNDLNFIKFLKNNNIQYLLLSEQTEEVINKFKLKYMDYGLIFKKEKNKKEFDLSNIKDLFFGCSKIYISSKGVFNTKYAYLNNINNLNKVIDDDVFWEDLQDLHIFTIDNI
jgi:hypothetical protein